MLVYRISRAKWAKDLSGEGARLFGGRWNRKGIPCLYTSASTSLAILEYAVNVNLEDIPRSMNIVTLKVPDHVHEVKIEDLPGNWSVVPAPASAKDFGSRLLTEGEHGIIRLPSSVIPKEYNYIINPGHNVMKQCKILAIEDFVFDVRIKEK